MASERQPNVGTAGTQWQVRPFGQMLNDINIDPLERPRPIAVARILDACLSATGNAPSQAELMTWPVSRRLQGLLAITIATRGDRWTMTANCDVPACGAPMDLPLNLNAFRREVDQEKTSCDLPDGRRLEITVPTGADQLTWLAAGDIGPGAILHRLVAVPDDAIEISAAALEAIEEALEEADPLTTLEIETVCPECGAENSIPLDLEGGCLNLLAAERPRLVDDIHVLATAYHWSEAEILAIPPTRRRQYLARIDRMWS